MCLTKKFRLTETCTYCGCPITYKSDEAREKARAKGFLHRICNKAKKNTPAPVKPEVNYFKAVETRVAEIDQLAQAYLGKFEFLPNDEICQRIHTAAWTIFKAANEDWKAVPEWVASVCDGYIPYTGGTRNGSLHHALAFSPVSQDAHLRNLLEIAEGRETKELDFPIVAEMPKD